ncbi:MAG: SpoIID/LytB domain-containing protein [bacterium]
MLNQEPIIRIGIFEHEPYVTGRFDGRYTLPNSVTLQGSFRAIVEQGNLILLDDEEVEVMRGQSILCIAARGSKFLLQSVTIGVHFHWERKEDQIFEGDLELLLRDDDLLTAINTVRLEQYLKSVISSEMSAEAPLELLKAHAITSRSWLVAMLEKERLAKHGGALPQRSFQTDSELVRWYDREDHSLFDVCADDHCQRYQGVTKIISSAAENAVEATRGLFLVHEGKVCDARFYKACGGMTEQFEHVWEDTPVSYLHSISDSVNPHKPIASEEEADRWIRTSPEAFCNTTDGEILRQVLPSFDQETSDFFRWRVEYSQEELREMLRKKSGIDFGTILNLVPVRRGPSGRIYALRIEGTNRTLVVGKELEIRRWLSQSHLYSSAFVVTMEKNSTGTPLKFILHGAGWGHGVGLCQIGAAVMAARGYEAEKIVKHYFHNAELMKLYD